MVRRVGSPTVSTNVALAVHSWGPGPPRVLLLHGLSSAAPAWELVGETLAAFGYSSLAPDLRGHGSSPEGGSYRIEDYTTDVLRACPGPWELVVGHSLGGAIAVWAADEDPEFANRLLLIDPAIEVEAEVAFGIRDQVVIEASNPPSAEALLEAHPGWQLEDAVRKREALRATSPEVLAATIEDTQPWAWGARLVGVPIPVHILGADPNMEPLFLEATFHALSPYKPDLTFTVVPGTGHSIYRDDPGSVISVILELLDAPRG